MKTFKLSGLITASALLLCTASVFAQTESALFTFLAQPTYCAQYMGGNDYVRGDNPPSQYAQDLANVITSLQEQGDTVASAFAHIKEFCALKQQQQADVQKGKVE
jgi:hypothetical protein